MLHVHCGDSSASTLREAGVAGEVVVWCDPLAEGPTPAGVTGEAWYALRGEWLEAALGGGVSRAGIERRFREEQAALERWGEHDELVLWFDGCMFDMAILARHLDWLSRQKQGAVRWSLICAAEFPGKPAYRGLGELNGEELKSLLPGRKAITGELLALGRAAWGAWGAADPREVERVIRETDMGALPCLSEALARHLEELPSVTNGLGRLEYQALKAVEGGARTLGEVFAASSAMERRPWFGDTTLWATMDDLCRARVPLLAMEDGERIVRWEPPAGACRRQVRLTESGQRVLAGRADAVALNGVERWVGGVRVSGRQAAWRWDGKRVVQGR